MPSTETLPAPELSPREQDKWRQEQRAFLRLLPELLLTHRDHFVAVHEGQVVASGEDKIAVASRAYERFSYVPIYVTRVSEEPPTPLRIPSPRQLGGPAR
jgi:hypothetical protein